MFVNVVVWIKQYIFTLSLLERPLKQTLCYFTLSINAHLTILLVKGEPLGGKARLTEPI